MGIGWLSGAWGIAVVVGVVILGIAIIYGVSKRRRPEQPPSLPADSPRAGMPHPERPDLNRQ